MTKESADTASKSAVTPAKAGVQCGFATWQSWIPAFAGMTKG
ncbi:hypothetical protein [Qipengyuania marisflavi]|nr:hypothetical protein [Qipengyuania marisflavi]